MACRLIHGSHQVGFRFNCCKNSRRLHLRPASGKLIDKTWNLAHICLFLFATPVPFSHTNFCYPHLNFSLLCNHFIQRNRIAYFIELMELLNPHLRRKVIKLSISFLKHFCFPVVLFLDSIV